MFCPARDTIQSYRWQGANLVKTGADADSSREALILWDTPGYEQVAREDLRSQVIDYASQADLLLLVTPALDPALQVDADFLQAGCEQKSPM